MTKKYNLILGTREEPISNFPNDTQTLFVGYQRYSDGQAFLSSGIFQDELSDSSTQFTQDEIDKLKASLPTKGMRAVVDASKVKVPEVPLYYMQSKRINSYGYRLFFALLNDNSGLENTCVFSEASFEDFLEDMDSDLKVRAFLTKEELEPYLTPDRELIKYEPKEDEDD